MSEYHYHVVMETPLGPKRGDLHVRLAGSAIRGTLYILEREEPISGSLTGKGRCRLHGRIITRMRTLDYTAEGVLDSSHIALTIHEARNTFFVRGTAVPAVKGGYAGEGKN